MSKKNHLPPADRFVDALMGWMHQGMEITERHFTWRNIAGIAIMAIVALFVWVGGPGQRILAGSAMLLILSYGYRLWTRRITITVDPDHGEVAPEKPLQE